LSRRRFRDMDKEESPFPPERSGSARALLWGIIGGMSMAGLVTIIALSMDAGDAVKAVMVAFVLGALGGALASGVGSLPPRHSTLEEMGKIPPRPSSKAIPFILNDGESFDLNKLGEEDEE